MHPFRAAVGAHDGAAFLELLSPDVTFVSPVAFKPYTGRDLVAGILRGALRTFDGLAYDREIAQGSDLALMFNARVGGLEVQGCDFLHLDAEGLIDHFTVMVRPLSAAQAVAVARRSNSRSPCVRPARPREPGHGPRRFT